MLGRRHGIIPAGLLALLQEKTKKLVSARLWLPPWSGCSSTPAAKGAGRIRIAFIVATALQHRHDAWAAYTGIGIILNPAPRNYTESA
jgi:hypothetical protein